MMPSEQQPVNNTSSNSATNSPAAEGETLKVLTDRPSGSCPWCAKLLGYDSKYYGACDIHRICSKCNRPMQPAEIEYCETYDITPTHSRCLPSAIQKADDGSALVAITQKDLDHLNLCRLLITPNLDWNPETNAKEAEFKTYSMMMDMSLDEKYSFVKRVEGILAAASVAIKKDRKQAELNASKRAAEQFEKAKKEIQANAVKAPRTAAKAMTDEEKKREKAIAGFMAIGMSREVAETMVAAAKEQKKN